MINCLIYKIVFSHMQRILLKTILKVTSTPLPSSSQPTLSEDSEVPSTAVTPADHHDDMQHKLDLHHKNVPPKSSGAVECLTIQEDEGESHPSQTNQDAL